MTETTALHFGTDVEPDLRAILAADPTFTHPDYVEHPAWVLRDMRPVPARIVGVRRGHQPASYAATGYVVIAEGSNVVIGLHWASVFFSEHDAAMAQAELDETFDL